ncbi:MAG: lipoprotein [Chryseotalea sp.]
MKKILALLAAVVLLASCSQYTCPTYSKAAPKKTENRI